LAAGWVNASLNATVDFAVESPVFADQTVSLGVTPIAKNGHLYLRSDAGLDTTPYTIFRFAAQASAPGERFAAVLFDDHNEQIGTPARLEKYGGDLLSGAWRYYSIPLADLGASHRVVKGIVIVEALGKAQPTIYLADLGFSP
jgi:hypothetical protein